MPAAAWASRPDLRPWAATLAERAERWRPDPALGIDASLIVQAVEEAAAAAESWLVHPCVNALTWPTDEFRTERDVRFITWVAAHTRKPVGTITLDRPSWRWSVAGHPLPVRAGQHDVAQLVAPEVLATDRRLPAYTVAVDPYCQSLGFLLPRSWSEPLSPADASLVTMTVREIDHALALFARMMPACAGWVASVTRVIVPLRPYRAVQSSGSQPELPGLIQLAGLHGPVAALEGLVHESAHHHFTMLEAAEPLVEPRHQDLYRSPLRDEPRPLRNVLLAVHALRHIVIFYEDGAECGLLTADWRSRQSYLEHLLKEGLTSLVRGRPHFTTSGDMLLGALLCAPGLR
jgi:HEXXH motif-containing protein